MVSVEDDYEFVSTETVEEIIVWGYKVLLRLSFFVKDITSLNDIKVTVKASLVLFVAWIISTFLSDSAFLWLLSNIVLTHPLYYSQQREQIDRIVGLVNLNIDKAIYFFPFVRKLERKPKEETKKNQ
jgi:hypothetical protein